MTPVRSLAEIQAACTKAARGAGCAWGVAEEAGMAARVLHSYGVDGSGALAELFQTPRACACDGSSDRACGLRVMAALTDAPPPGDGLALEHGVVAPVLMLAALHLMAQDGQDWMLEWAGGSAVVSGQGLAMRGEAPPLVADRLRVSKADAVPDGTPRSWASQPVDPEAWQVLLDLCDKTYVPESDQSRASGAGPADDAG